MNGLDGLENLEMIRAIELLVNLGMIGVLLFQVGKSRNDFVKYGFIYSSDGVQNPWTGAICVAFFWIYLRMIGVL